MIENTVTELNLYAHDAARAIQQTMHGSAFRRRYEQMLEQTIFGIIRRQRELGIAAEDTVTFLMHFLRVPREMAEWQRQLFEISEQASA